jgi:diguanylate cyclase (GGDEF)-like protein
MSRRERRRGFGVRYVLLAVAAVPLCSFLFLAAATVHDANHEVAAAQQARTAGEEVTAYTTLEAAVAVEHYWGGALTGVREFGFEPAELRDFLGVDVGEEWVKAQAVVDDLRETVPDTGVGALLEEARAALDVGAGGAYIRADGLADAEVERVRQELEEAALRVDAPEQMVWAAEVLSNSIQLRAEVFDLVANLFGARFPDAALTDRSEQQLIAARARYDAVALELAADVAVSAPLAAALESIEQDPHTVALLDDVDRVIASIGTPVSPTDPTSELMLQASTFANSLAVLQRFGDAVEVANAELMERGEALTTEAEETRRNVVIAIAVVGALTFGVVAGIGRWLVHSLDGISATATAMNDGELDRPAPVQGPTEVRVAAQALNGAAANIRSAERQVLALASGDLSEPDGPTHVPGRLGDSLHAAFDRLAESMKDRESLRRELHLEANHDGLTGLPNRSAIMKALAAAADAIGRDGGQLAVLFVDVDDFKAINDHHGHAVGDEVLKGIARRVRLAARSSDLVGRLGGDELVVIAHPVSGAEDALGLARRIRKAVTRPLASAGSISPSISIGVAVGAGAGTTPGQLLHDADLAVYEAKAAGGNVIEVCSPVLREASDHRQEVERSLTAALADDELAIALQAVMASDGRRVLGVEALVRWPQADGSVRQPGEFVGIAERSNLVVELDRWVIGETVRMLARWRHDTRTASLSASVNISARHASVVPFAEHIVRTLDRQGVDPGRLVVELTESALIANIDHVVEQLRVLRAHGVSVAVDDFGTGYTSLALLHQLPIDTLKLDRVLTAALGRERVVAVVRLIVDTAHLIGLSVTAEGVETAAQAEELRILGVDALQGYHLHRPCPSSGFAAELTELDEVAALPDPA